MRRRRAREIGIFVGCVGGGVAIDALLGSFPAAAGSGSLVYAVRVLLRTLRLHARIVRGEHDPRAVAVPAGADLWADIEHQIARLRHRSRKRKRGLTRFASRFRQATSALPDALIMLDGRDRIDWANPAANRLLGIAIPRDTGRPFAGRVEIPLIEEYLQAGEFNRPVEFSSAANRRRVLSLRVAPFGGKRRQKLIVVRDITEIHNLNQVRRDFIANVSHELRTPLTVISGFIENLLHSEHPDFQQRPLQLMEQQSTRMANIISELLALSRLELEDEARESQPVAVPEMAQEIADQARALSGDRGHRIELEVDSGLWLLGAEQELRSAFSNLVFNAVIHTPPRSSITIRWRAGADEAVFSVTDTGSGIAERHIPRLTERFYRVDKQRSRESGGTGLGLAIVKHVLVRHHAELRISSRIGFGSTFSCHFPRERTLTAREAQSIERVHDAVACEELEQNPGGSGANTPAPAPTPGRR